MTRETSKRNDVLSFALGLNFLLSLGLLIALPGILNSEELVYFDSSPSAGVLNGGAAAIEDTGLLMSGAEGPAGFSANSQTVLSNGRSSNRIDIVFLGDGYTSAELSAYSNQVDNLLVSLLSESPLAEYQAYFNAHRIDLESLQSGVDHDPGYGVLKNTTLDMQFWCHESESTLCVDVSKALSAAGLAPDADQIIALANSLKTGSAAYPFSDLSLVSAAQAQAGESLLHQFGHAFGNLADEYDSGSWPEYTGYEPAEPNVSALTSNEMSFQEIKWHAWLGFNSSAEFGGIIGTYEGAMQHRYKIYRPTLNSKMRALGEPFNMPSIESFIVEIYRLVDPIDSATPTDSVLTGGDQLFVIPMEPSDHQLSIQWLINGQVVQGATGRTFRVDDYPFPDGSYEVSVVVVDNTPWVRNEEARSRWMTSTRAWQVVVDQELPVIVTQPADQTVNVGAQATFGVVAEGGELSYQWYKDTQAIAGATKNIYTTPSAQHGDNGAKYWVKVTNIAGSVNSRKATLTVLNRLPQITAPGSVSMYRKETRTVSISGSDADGDVLSYSATVANTPGLPADVVSVIGNVVTIKPGSTYLGTFQVTVRAFDGYGFSEAAFAVSVLNRKPVFSPIPQQIMHWKQDFLSLSLSASDLDGDAVTYSASLAAGETAPVAVSVSGNTLKINPEAGYLGTCDILVSASDGIDTEEKAISVVVYNTAPKIVPIANKSMHYKQDSIQLTLSASDADGDPISFAAEVFSGGAENAVLSISGNVLTINPVEGFVGVLGIKASAADEKSSTAASFSLNVYNTAPFLQNITEQKMHWRERSREVQLIGSDADGDALSFTAVIKPGCQAPLNVTVLGAKLNIAVLGDYLGSCFLDVTASDGKNFVTKSCLVTIYDTAPDLKPIASQNISWNEDVRQVELVVVDADNEPHTFTAQITPDATARLLDESYDFHRRDESWHYDLNGLKGKYFLGMANGQEVWFVILPDGKLYRWRETLEASELIAKLPLSYYSMPSLLFDVPESPADIPVEISFEDYTMSINPEASARGTFVVVVHASDGIKSDSESFLLTVHDAVVTLSPVRSASMFWTDDLGTVELSATDADGEAGGSSVVYGAEYYLQTQAYDLDSAHNFRLLPGYEEHPEDYPFNTEGRLEKYIGGWNSSNQWATYVITPTGDLFELQGSIDNSERIAMLPPVYYQDPTLLFDVPPPPVFFPVSLSFMEAVLNVNPESGFSGRFLLKARASLGEGADEEVFVFTVNNQAPIIEEIDYVRVGRTAESAHIPVRASDPDNDPLTLQAMLGSYSNLVHALSVEHQFQEFSGDSPANNPLNHNRYGWGEKHFSGRYQGVPAEFIILPNGEIRLWAGSVPSSIVLDRVSSSYHSYVYGLFNAYDPGPLPPVSLSFENSIIELLLPLSYSGSFPVTAEASDGNLYDDETFTFVKANYAPYIYPIDPQILHWRTDAVEVNINAVDAENDPLTYQAEFYDTKYVRSLDQAHNFQLLTADWQYNKRGKEEKYFQGVVNGNVRQYVIRPVYCQISGAFLYAGLYEFQGTLEQSVMIASLPRPYHQDPSLLFDVPEPGHYIPAVLSINGNVLTVDPLEKYTGSFVVTVLVSDEFTTSNAHFLVTVYDSIPEVAEIKDQNISWTREGLSLPLSPSDADSADRPYLAYEVRVGTPAHAAYELDQQYDFTLVGEDHLVNQYGWKGKYLGGVDVGQEKTYVIYPSGEIYEWRGRFADSLKVGRVSTEYYRDPSLLIDVAQPEESPPAQVEVSGNTLIVLQPEGYSGTFSVLLSLSDGLMWDNEVFNVTVANSPPTLAAIPNSKVHWKTDYLELDLLASDPDGDALSFAAELDTGFNAPVTFSFNGAKLRIDPEDKYTGTFYVRVRVSDGTNSAERLAFVWFYDSAPVLGVIGSKVLGRNDSTLSVSLSASDVDKEPLVYSAELAPENHGDGSLVLNGNQLVFTKKQGFLGTVRATVSVSDGLLSDAESFDITVANRAPELSQIPGQSMGWREGIRRVSFSAIDPDNDTLSLSARIASSDSPPGSVSIAGSEVVIQVTPAYVGAFTVEVSASDGAAEAKRQFLVRVQNTPPILSYVPTQYINLGEEPRELTLVATDADQDPLSFSAAVPETYKARGSVSISGAKLTIAAAESSIGSFLVKLSVTDGQAFGYQDLWVVVQNAKPDLQAIPDQKMHWSEEFVRIPLVTEDTKQELLNYTAKITQGAPFPLEVITESSSLLARLKEPKLGSVTILVTVSDGFAEDAESFTLEVVNTAPYVAPVATQYVQKGVPGFDVEVEIFDPDGDVITTSVEVVDTQRIAYELDRVHNFELRWNDYYANSLGNAEKYFQGTKNQPSGLYWYVIFPNGDLYEWSGRLSTSKLLARLPQAFYQDPRMLFNATEPAFSGAPATALLLGDRLSINPDPSYSGEFYLKVSADDSIEKSLMMFSVIVNKDGDDNSDPGECKLTITPYLGEYTGGEASVSFTAEGRIGDSATGPGARTFEVDVSRSTAGPFAAGETANYIWENGVPTPFTLTYDAASKTATFSVDGVVVSHAVLDSNAFTDIIIRARAAKPDAVMEIESLVLDGLILEGSVAASGSTSGVNVLQVTRGMLQHGFVLEGMAKMSWGVRNGGNLIANGGFEEPVITDPSGWDIYTEEQLGGWKVAWMYPETACPSGADTATPVLELQRNLLVPAEEGQQYAELDSDCQGPTRVLGEREQTTVRIWQDIPTVPGREYELRFYARRRPGSVHDKRLTVKWDGSKLLDSNTLPETWNEKHFKVKAKKAVTRVEFMDVGVADTLGVFLDNIRVIDTVAAAVPSNSELSFQISLASVSGHNPECPPDDGTQPDDDEIQCETRKLITSPVYTLWNSFLGMVNILELVNPTKAQIDVRVSLYSIIGELVHEQVFPVPAENQFDVILNQFPGYIGNSYGVVKLEFEGLLDGRMMYYRQAADTFGYDFVFGFALEDAMSGRTAVSFNTFQPSFKEDERDNIVANWLTIVNLEQRPQQFTVLSYDQMGTLLLRRQLEVPSFGRVDVDGGHDLAGPSVVGSHIILPADETIKYISLLTRFGGNVPAGYAPSEYRFAFPLMARRGASQAVYAPITNKFEEFNWLEVINILDEEVRAAVSLYSADGQLLEAVDVVLAAHAQEHIDAARFVGAGNVGYAVVIPKTPNSLVAQSMVYYRDAATGSITSLYGSQARRAYPCSVAGSYNLFLNMENYLSVANPSDEDVSISVLLTGPNLREEKKFSVPARKSLNLEIHNPELFSPAEDSYGLVSVKTNGSGRIFAELIRVRWREDGVADFAVPTAVR